MKSFLLFSASCQRQISQRTLPTITVVITLKLIVYTSQNCFTPFQFMTKLYCA